MTPTLSHRGRLLLSLGAILCYLGLGGLLFGEAGLIGLPEEAPTSLFALSYGSAEAELLVKGSWTAGLGLTAGLAIDGSGSVSLAGDQPLLFTQTPDLYISFLLFKKLFADLRVSSTLSESKYSLGYRGEEGQLLKEIRAGNDGIGFPVLPFLSLGAGSWRSFGAAADLRSGDFMGRAMVRYDQATRVEKIFIGSSEVTETLILATDFARGRWFVINLASGPTTASNLELYVQSTAGSLAGSDGLVYRKMADSEFTYSAATGLVSLAKTATTKLVAAYSGYAGVPGPYVTIGAAVGAILYDPDNASTATALAADTLALGRYVVSSGAGGDAYVRDLATGLADEGYSVSVDASGWAEVTRNSVVDPQKTEFRQPFAADMPWLYTTILSGDNLDKTYAPAASKVIVLRLYALSSKISVDTDVVEGSVEVSRNGIPDYAFTVDAASGSLTLGVAPGLDEEIRVSYLRESSERSSGSLAAGLGGFFDLGGGLSAWTALGLRWSVPGTSYASSGQTDPGKVVLTAGEKDGEGKFTQSLSLAAQWSTGEASGRYRVEGMESTTTYHLSFRPLSASSDFNAVELRESRLASEWPSLEAGLHADGSTQKALKLEATAASPDQLVLAKYIDAPPVADLRIFSFMARAGSDPASYTSVLSVAIDAGTAGASSSELYVSIPASELSTAWRRFVLKYGYGSLAVYAQDGEGGSLGIISGASVDGRYDPSLSSASRLLVSLSGASQSEIVWVDEILLDEASGAAALLFKGEAGYLDKDLAWGPWSLGRGLAFASDLSGAWSDFSYLGGGSSLSTRLGDLSLGARFRASLSPEGGSASGGHSIAFSRSGFPIQAGEVFDTDPSTGAFGRTDSLGLSLGRIMDLQLGQAASYSGAAAGGTGLFSQTWSAKASMAGGILGAGLEAKHSGYPKAWAGLQSSYADNWYEALGLFLPAREAEAKKRSLEASASLSAGSLGEVGKFTATASEEALAAIPKRDEKYSLKIQLPLALGEGLLISPYYLRSSSRRSFSPAAGLVDLGGTYLSEIRNDSLFWTSLPFYELFRGGSTTAEAFSAWVGKEGLSVAEYEPELGIVLARNYGSSLLDLVLPSALSLAWTRTFSKEDSSLSTASGLKLGMKIQAVNVLGEAGSYPFLLGVESDEYRTSLQFEYSLSVGDATPSLSLILQNLATFYGSGSRDSLNLDNRLSWKRDASTTAWSESLDLSLSLRRERSWLLDLYGLAIGAATKPHNASIPAGAQAKAGAQGPTAVSAWLSALGASSPVCRTILAVVADVDSTTDDGKANVLSVSASESATWKLVFKDLLSLACTASLVQSRSGDTGVFVVGPKLELTATISF